jgi:2-polyprenyl-3-methyl-5-hydroxy-6-metoxy-1,4-benzoquinol methylase
MPPTQEIATSLDNRRNHGRAVKVGWPAGLAFGVDPTRAERYSLRQSRYAVLADDIAAWAGEAVADGRTLTVLDVGCGWGPLLCHLEGKRNFDKLSISGTDLGALGDTDRWKSELYREFFIGDLTGGYPEIPSDRYDVVVCEQVLEHLADFESAIETLARVLRPGGRLIIGVPIFLPPLHLARLHLVPPLAKILRHPETASHQQAFSLGSLRRRLRQHSELKVLSTRGFRILSGGILRRLENYLWWWKLNRKLGALFPAACIEVQVVIEKELLTCPRNG